MRQKSNTPETPSERLVRDIRRAIRKQYSAEVKIRIVLDGLRGEVTIAELCRREGIDKSKRDDGTFSREDFVYDKDRNIYTCPAGKTLKTSGKLVNGGATLL